MTSFTMERKLPSLDFTILTLSYLLTQVSLPHVLTFPEHRNPQRAALDTQPMPHE